MKIAWMSLLSVILPNYNHAKWLKYSLRAVAQQSNGAVEILVVDDASIDESIEVIRELAREFPAIRLLRHAQNKGVVAAIQTGLDAAHGNFLLFAAADDLVLPGLVERGLAALTAHPDAAFFCSGVGLVDENDDILGFRPVAAPRSTPGYVSPGEVRRAIRATDNWFIGSSVIYRRADLAQIGYFDASLGSLCDGLANRCLAFEHGFYFDPDVLSVWRRYANSYSAQVALTQGESERSLLAAERWISARYPEDVRCWYASLFDRRYRYNLARLRVIWSDGRPDAGQIADLMRLGAIDRACMRLFARVPVLNSRLLLAWGALRLRPFSFIALIKAWWRSKAGERSARARLQECLDRIEEDAQSPTPPDSLSVESLGARGFG
jgi:glycosyltransferase involved in cell wall biosynthesis